MEASTKDRRSERDKESACNNMLQKTTPPNVRFTPTCTDGVAARARVQSIV